MNIKKYQNILYKEDLKFLKKYLELEELKRLKHIGYFCGMDYCSKDIMKFNTYYSRFDHSLSTALITYNFTKDKTQTISALIHDISTPAFSHVIDYMKKDYKKQETTELKTEKIIKNSKQLYEVLKTDNINISEITDYKRYKIVDNDIPKLCADRLDSIFMSNSIWLENLNLEQIKEIYEKLKIINNEEIGSEDIETAKNITKLSLKVGYATNYNNDKICMQLLADIIKLSIEHNLIFEEMLYFLKEEEILDEIKNTKNKNIKTLYETFKNMKEVINEEELFKKEQDNYYISFSTKKRYVDVLTDENKRISQIDEDINQEIEEYKNYEDTKYAYTKKIKSW